MTTARVVHGLFGSAMVVLVVLTLLGLVVWIGMHSWLMAALFVGIGINVLLNSWRWCINAFWTILVLRDPLNGEPPSPHSLYRDAQKPNFPKGC